MKLCDLKINEEAKIINLKCNNILKRRFLDLGLIPGEIIKCVLISPFNNPKAYLINNNVYALRNDDANFIEVIYERV